MRHGTGGSGNARFQPCSQNDGVGLICSSRSLPRAGLSVLFGGEIKDQASSGCSSVLQISERRDTLLSLAVAVTHCSRRCQITCFWGMSMKDVPGCTAQPKYQAMSLARDGKACCPIRHWGKQKGLEPSERDCSDRFIVSHSGLT